MIVRMWEARCAPGRTDDGVAWAQQVASEALVAGAAGAEVFRSVDRVVLLTRWSTPSSWQEPVPDAEVVARSHAWPFDAVEG